MRIYLFALYTLSCLTINGQHTRQTTTSEMLVDQQFSLQGKLTLLIYRLPSMNEIETMNTIVRRYRIEDFQVVQVELENLTDTSLPKSASERWLVMADRKGKFTNKLFTGSVPNNILVDEKGQVIATNCGIVEINMYLQEFLARKTYFVNTLEPK
jgi:hypothetical protein